MRTEGEMLRMIMDKARKDERIRAAAMDGSRANANAVHDSYSDFDIVYFVTDIREFTQDKSWITYFGEILIVQYPMDWYEQPYDYDSNDDFNYLIQFADGNRIDLSLVDIRNIKKEAKKDEPRIVLLDKDGYQELHAVDNEKAFYITPPGKMEFYNVCNEFRWICLYVTKGLCRREIYYAKYAYDVLAMAMFMKMLNWKIGTDHDFQVATGSHGKYLKRFLTEPEMKRVHDIFPGGEYEDIWDKLFLLYDYFAGLEAYVGKSLGYPFDKEESRKVRQFMLNRSLNTALQPSKSLPETEIEIR